MADTEDLKSSGSQGPCGFESRPRHLVPATSALISFVRLGLKCPPTIEC
jgi:hypothetical protein